MKVVFLEWKSLGNHDMLQAYKELGHEVVVYDFPRERIDNRNDLLFEEAFARYLKREKPDYVFSFNYFPIVSKVCHNIGDMPYVSWVYDSPYAMIYSFTVIFPCNHIYVFDKDEALFFARNKIPTVHYLPMAANVKRLKELTSKDVSGKIKHILPKAPVSFVGGMYTEKELFYDKMKLDPETHQALENIMELQMQIWGDNYIEESLTPEIIAKMEASLGLKPNGDGVETSAYLYAQYVINRKITSIERSKLIGIVGEKYGCNLYTRDVSIDLPGINIHGPVDYYDVAPIIYNKSTINLNITLRSIKSGMPLRVFDIFGAGGFLLSNYQKDFDEFFIEGEDYDSYRNENEFISKIEYYVNHENECQEMAMSAQKKVEEKHTYIDRIKEWESQL